LRSHRPPLATITRANYVIYLRRLLEELAWTQHLPDLAHLLGRDDVTRKEHRLPRPLTPEQDALIQQELRRRDDLLSNALLLLRHTGMRISESVDLSFDCLRLVGPGQWAIHVPLGKLKTERLVPVDSMVCQLVERIRSLRPPRLSPVFSYCLDCAAAVSWFANCVPPCAKSPPLSAFPPASSRTNFDIHMERRCCALALALPRSSNSLVTKVPT
jgi:integrase